MTERVHNPEGDVTIAIVGKYTGMKDAYKSLIEALAHGGMANRVRVHLDWIESEVFEGSDPAPRLERVDGILVPGGFGQRGAEGKILAARFARERNVPYFGICFGMQMAVIEAGAVAGRHCRCQFDRIRRDERSCRRADDGMDARQRIADARCGRRAWRHDAARRLFRLPQAGFENCRHLRRDGNLPSAIATATKSTWPYREQLEEKGLIGLRGPVHRMACCRKRSNSQTIPGLSASNIIRS